MKILLRALTYALLMFALFVGVAQLRAAAPDSATKNLPGTLGLAADTAAAADNATPHPAAAGDALLEALLTELDRSKAQLKIDQVQAPYYIEYRVNDVDDYDAEAAFGALRESQRVRLRILRVVVRVGDYKQDSYFGQGMGETNILPLDNDPIALRHQIWLTTDEAYKAAGQALAEKQAEMKRFSADPNPVDDFSKEPVITALDPIVSLKLDENAWAKTLEDMTPAVIWFDEIEMGITSGEAGGQQGRIFAFFLTWMQEKARGLFVAATANRIDLLPAEMIRKGRFDEVFFVDLPLVPERIEILKIHLERRDVDGSGFNLERLAAYMKGWTGAEIEQAVVSALTKARLNERQLTEQDLFQAAGEVVPLSQTMKEQINHIRSWAFERAVRASPVGVGR